MDAQKRLEALLASERLVHFEFDARGVITTHEGSVGLLGAPHEAVGRSVLVDFPSLPWLAAHARRALAGETLREHVELDSGTVRLRYLPLADDAGRVALVIVLGSDVTEQLRRERALAESEDRYRSLSDAAFEAVGIHDRGRILEANQRMAEMFGYSIEELRTMSAVELAAPETKAELVRRIAMRTDEAYRGVGLRKDGSRFVAELRSRATRYQGRDVRITAIRDVSAEVEAEEERARLFAAEQAARATAEAALRIRDEFMSIAAHELNSPLTSLKVRVEQLAELVRDEPIDGAWRARAAELVEVCQRQANRLQHLVRDLLDVTRIRSGQLSIERRPLDLVELVRDVVSRSREELARARCAIEVSLPPSLWGDWDRARLEQVLVNLIGNAMKFGAGTPIEVGVVEADGGARVTVRDHGPGIAPELQDKIFDRFMRSSQTKALGGLGLGLYIVKQIVAAHGGRVGVASVPGQGAAFTVELPR